MKQLIFAVILVHAPLAMGQGFLVGDMPGPRILPLAPVHVEGGNSLTLEAPSPAIQPKHLGLVVNLNDPQSVDVAAHYQDVYNIPERNIVEVELEVSHEVSFAKFSPQVLNLHRSLPRSVEAIAVTWTEPYRVTFPNNTCALSVTSAITFGNKPQELEKYCELNNNTRTTSQKIWNRVVKKLPQKAAFIRQALYEKNTPTPHAEFNVRPAMMLAGKTTDDAIGVIDRGHASRKRALQPVDAHLILTSDRRSVLREEDFERLDYQWAKNPQIDTKLYPASSGTDHITEQSNILFYFTGQTAVPGIAQNEFVPGAIADHVTSFGGKLMERSGHMSVLEWLSAGATGTFGNVVEPLGVQRRFPRSEILVRSYFEGHTLLQAYWSAVEDPLMGLFIGDPLACPFGTRAKYSYDDETLTITSTSLQPYGKYRVLWRKDSSSSFIPVGEMRGKKGARVSLVIEEAQPIGHYRIERVLHP